MYIQLSNKDNLKNIIRSNTYDKTLIKFTHTDTHNRLLSELY